MGGGPTAHPAGPGTAAGVGGGGVGGTAHHLICAICFPFRLPYFLRPPVICKGQERRQSWLLRLLPPDSRRHVRECWL